MTKIKQDLIDKIKTFYRQGQNVADIAQELGLHRSTVYKYLREVRLLNFKSRYAKINHEDRLFICDLYEQGATMKELKQEFQVSLQSINKILIDSHIQKRAKGRKKTVFKNRRWKDKYGG